MQVGTKSVLFGAHQFLIHPWFVAAAWWRLYGFPLDPRLWVAFFVHDIGYIGKSNMDGPEGERHPVAGASIMSTLFDRWELSRGTHVPFDFEGRRVELGRWGLFTLLHSRYFAKSLGRPYSRLCVADKLAIALTPSWLYLPMVRATGEVREYMAHAKHRVEPHMTPEEVKLRRTSDEREWYAGVQSYCRRWAFEHADGRADTWTTDSRNRATVNDSGVWQ